MMAPQRRSVQSTMTIKNTFVVWVQNNNKGMNRSLSWPLLSAAESHHPVLGISDGLFDIACSCAEDDEGASGWRPSQKDRTLSGRRASSPPFHSPSENNSEINQIETTFPRKQDALPTWRTHHPARPSHLDLCSCGNTFDSNRQADIPPTMSSPTHSCRNSRADGDADYEFSLSTQQSSFSERDTDDIFARSKQATPSVLGTSSASIIDVAFGLRCSNSIEKTEDDDTPTTKNSDDTTPSPPFTGFPFVRGALTSYIDANVTTVVIRNLERRTTLIAFLAALDENGFQGTYDFAHLPFRHDKRHGLGLAFVNFLSPLHAQLFSDHSRYMGAMFGRKSRRLSVAPSEMQGHEWSVQRIVDSLKDNERDKPTFPPIAFVHGNIVSFPLCYVPEYY